MFFLKITIPDFLSSIYSHLKHSSIAKCAFLPSRPSTRLATNLPHLLPCKTREEKKHRKSCRFFFVLFSLLFFVAFLSCFSFGISSLASAMHGGLEMPPLPLVPFGGILTAVVFFVFFVFFVLCRLVVGVSFFFCTRLDRASFQCPLSGILCRSSVILFAPFFFYAG